MDVRVIGAIAACSALAACSANIHQSDQVVLNEKARDEESLEAKKPTYAGHILNCQQSLGHHLSEEEYECPIGGEKFMSLTLGTHSTYGRHLDWEPVSYMEFPAPLPVCPSNGFVIYKKIFSEDELRILGAAIKSPEYMKEFKDKNASYFLFGRLLEIIGNPDEYDLWWVFLNSTWEADQCGAKKYSRYALKTIDHARNALTQYHETDDEYWMLNIIIPNLYRRIGDFEFAKSWLEKLGARRPGDDVGDREFFNLAFMLLEQAIERRDQSQIAIEPPAGSPPEAE